MPRVSVLMPNYNASKYIEEAIDSILNQTYQDFEIILVDDCSTDNSVEIVKDINNPKIKLHSTPQNGGIVAALNEGLKHVTGEYIIRMDSDDISVNNRLEKLVSFMDEHPEIGVCGSYIQMFGTENGTWKYPTTDEAIRPNIYYSSMMPHAASIFRTSLFVDNQIQYSAQFPHMEDRELWVQLFHLTQFSNIPEALYHYRMLEHNVTVKNRSTAFERSVNFFMYLSDTFKIGLTRNEIESQQGMGFNVKITKESVADFLRWMDKIVEFNKQSNTVNHAHLLEHFNVMQDKTFNKIVRFAYFKEVWFYIKSLRTIKIKWIKNYLRIVLREDSKYLKEHHD